MSKVSFRARALDSNRPLHLHFDHEITDLSDYASISRSVPLLPSGMEKDEETEHHLQEALFAQQQFKSTDLHAIPIPEIDENANNKFKSLYHAMCGEGTFRMPKHYIRVQAFALDPGDNEVPDYDLDSEDEAWLQASKLGLAEVELERMLEQLERHSDHTVVSLNEAKALLKKDDGQTTAVYDYWLAKRLKHGHRLSLAIKAERRDGSSTNDPYVAFRRRTEKMQTRKHRKNDEASYEKMLKLRRDMERACSLFELLVRREEAKSTLLDTELRIFQRRYATGDFDGSQLRAAAKAAAARNSLAVAASGVPAVFAGREANNHHHHNHFNNHSRGGNGQLYHHLHHQYAGRHVKRARRQPPPPLPPPDTRLGDDSTTVYGELLPSANEDGAAAAAATAAAGSRYVWCRRRYGSVYAPPRPLVQTPLDGCNPTLSPAEHGVTSLSPPDPHRRLFSLTRLPWVDGSARYPRGRHLTTYVGLRYGRGGRLLLDRLSAPEVDPYLEDWDAKQLGTGNSPPALVCAHSGQEIIEEDPLFEHRLPAYEFCTLPDPSPTVGEG